MKHRPFFFIILNKISNNSIIQTDSIMMLHPSFFIYVTYHKLNFDLIKVSNSRFITLMYINLCFKCVISSLDVQFDEGRVADAELLILISNLSTQKPMVLSNYF